MKRSFASVASVVSIVSAVSAVSVALLLSLLAAAPIAASRVPPLSSEHQAWVDSTLESLTLSQKAGQLLMVRVPAGIHHPESAEHQALRAAVEELGVGGVVTFRGDRDNLPLVLNELQRTAAIPLLVAADFERGASFRIGEGAVSVPWAMAIGATRSAEAARFVGDLTAREARSLGIHWVFAPVVDVNNNPDNPVINLRSFAEDPGLVSELAVAFIEGAQQGGLMTAAKHFPGHGDTDVDSHHDLPRIEASRSRLDAVELAPFRAAIQAGVDAVMLGHLSVPALDPTDTPATLSSEMTTELLRNQLGFDGLIVTDGLEMKGLDGYGSTDALRRAVAAGSDLLLLPRDAKVAVDTLVRSVAEGVLDEARIDRSVRRILEAKARLGLVEERFVDPSAPRRAMGHPKDAQRALQIAQEAVTLVRNRGEILPLRADRPLRILHLELTADAAGSSRGIVDRELRQRAVDYRREVVPFEIPARRLDELVAASQDFTHVLVSAYHPTGGSGEPSLSPSQGSLLETLADGPRPLIVIAHRSPYLLSEAPEIPVYLITFGPAESSQRAIVSALFGETPITGRLPVSLPGQAEFGDGISLAARPMSLPAVEPETLGLKTTAFDAVDTLLEDYRAQGAFPGGILAVGYRGALVHLHPFGTLDYSEASPRVTVDTRYDLASLTKVIATTTLAMRMVDAGRLDLDAPIASYLPLFEGPGKERVTVRHLLTHSSGLDWWAPLHLELQGQEAYVRRIQASDLVYEPGAEMKYSDLGIILLGEILERISGVPLDVLAERMVFTPLGMEATGYRPDPREWSTIAPTEEDPWRGRVLQGEVHDENAFALGGVAPHAGLFGTAPDLARFAQMLLNRGVFEHRRLIAPATVDAFTRDAKLPRGSRRALGWDTRSPSGSSAGSLFSFRSFGHTGFTGTSLWIDPDRELFLILLTNRVHPTRENHRIREVRPAIADAVVRAVDPGAEPPVEPSPPVLTGLDRIDAGERHGLEGKRLGLVVHAASVTLDGKHAIEVFSEPGFEVVKLLSPEHGLAGSADAGEEIEDGVHAESGLPVASLYGAKTRPTPEDLAGLDALVFDLQGAGVRFYTYVSTLIGCLEAAGEAGIELIVLDRPNPLGGERVEGPLSAPRDVVAESFVNRAPGPLVHGLTLGEVARVMNARIGRPAVLTVVPMRFWRRSMTWSATGRPWVPPSPNLRTAEAALAYPGTALLEATNVSEGRGTGAPFLEIGAPWIDIHRLDLTTIDRGFSLNPHHFVPRAGPGAAHPKHRDQTCHGFRVEATDPTRAEPYALGVELLHRLRQEAEFSWRRDGQALIGLLGTPTLFEALTAGASVDDILARDREAIAAWREERKPFLLYD